MFLQLKVSTGALVLLLLQLHSGDHTAESFFNKRTLSFNLTVIGNSDVVLIKCPLDNFKNRKIRNVLGVKKIMQKLTTGVVINSIGEKMSIWIPLLRNSSGSTKIDCGKIGLEKDSNYVSNSNWTYNISWKGVFNLTNIEQQSSISSNGPPTHKNCDSNPNEILIFTKDKNGNVLKVNFSNTHKLLSNKLYYYFIKPNKNDSDVIKQPCAIFGASKNCPKIEIQNYNSTHINFYNFKINLVEIKEKTVEINIKPFVDGNGNITVSKIKYLKNNVIITGNSKYLLANKLNVKLFDFIKLSYDCQLGSNKTTISQIYYFGSINKKYKSNDDIIIYNRNNSNFKPNCSLNSIPYGFLETIIYDGKSINLNDLNGNSKKSTEIEINGNFVFLTNIKKNFKRLECIYRTPSGTTTKPSMFGSKTSNDQGNNFFELRSFVWNRPRRDINRDATLEIDKTENVTLEIANNGNQTLENETLGVENIRNMTLEIINNGNQTIGNETLGVENVRNMTLEIINNGNQTLGNETLGVENVGNTTLEMTNNENKMMNVDNGTSKTLNIKNTENKTFEVVNSDNQKSVFQKIVDKIGRGLSAGILCVIMLSIIVIFAIILYYLKKHILDIIFEIKNSRKIYPNLYHFWYNLREKQLDQYCEIVNDIEYIPDKVKNNRENAKIALDDEENVVSIINSFDNFLVKCYNKIDKQLRAHYVYTDSIGRKYIISDGPTKKLRAQFWEMIFEEDVCAVVAIIFKLVVHNDNDYSNKIYWPEVRAKYGNMTVEHVNNINMDITAITCNEYKITNQKKVSKNVRIFHFNDWPEHSIPPFEFFIVHIYKMIWAICKDGNVLVHGFQGTGSRVYMYTYFSCICDAMMTNKSLSNPMEIVKMIRERRYGGNISTFEYAHILKALLLFFEEESVVIDRQFRFNIFQGRYDDYTTIVQATEFRLDNDFVSFHMFAHGYDIGKVRELKISFAEIKNMSTSELESNCKLFHKLIKNGSCNKIRYKEIPCLDATMVDIGDEEKDEKDIFIHASKHFYRNIDKFERKLIICQAPVKDTIDDMFKMICKHKISSIVILLRPDECHPTGDKWIQYLPQTNEALKTKICTIKRISFKDVDENMIAESEYTVDVPKSKPFTFKVFHYQGWPDKGIPSDYLHICKLRDLVAAHSASNYIVIQCSSGTERSGTFAFILYLMDTLFSYRIFDPIERLKSLRKKRYKAIHTFNQFFFAILVVFEKYNNDLNKLDVNGYNRFYDLAQKVFLNDDIY